MSLITVLAMVPPLMELQLKDLGNKCRKKDGVDLLMTLTFSNNSVLFTNTCNFGGQYLAAQVYSAARYGNGRLEIYDKDEKTEYDSTGKYSCSVSVVPGNLNYSFKGRCLVLSQGSEQKIFIPAN